MQTRVYKALIWLTLYAAALHFFDNVYFFNQYPEPAWLNPPLVGLLWIPLALLAHRAVDRIYAGRVDYSYSLIHGFVLGNWISLGHYLFASPLDVLPRINFAICLQVGMATLLFLWTMWMQLTRARVVALRASRLDEKPGAVFSGGGCAGIFLAIPLEQLVVWMDVKESHVDTLLVWLAIIAPLLLVTLSRWQGGLIDWYVPTGSERSAYFSEHFAKDVLALPEASKVDGLTLLLVSDSSCPCSRASLTLLRHRLKDSPRHDWMLRVMDVNDTVAARPDWVRVLRQIPATPTLLIVEDKRLVYAGPVNSGNFCTTEVRTLLGLAILQSAPQAPVFNWLQKGCYCPLKMRELKDGH